jgi:hypothetical protein
VSVAVSATDTFALYHVPEHVVPSHDAVVVGGAVSGSTTVTACDCGVSESPATSVEKNLTVVVLDTVIGPV